MNRIAVAAVALIKIQGNSKQKLQVSLLQGWQRHPAVQVAGFLRYCAAHFLWAGIIVSEYVRTSLALNVSDLV